MPILDLSVAVWRNLPVLPPGAAAQNFKLQPTKWTNVPASIVPISSFDQSQPYSYGSTHVLWVPYWLDLLKDDEVRYGRRPRDEFSQLAAAQIVPFVYVVNGRRRFPGQGPTLTAYYAKEKD